MDSKNSNSAFFQPAKLLIIWLDTKSPDEELLGGSEIDLLDSRCKPKDFFCHKTIRKT